MTEDPTQAIAELREHLLYLKELGVDALGVRLVDSAAANVVEPISVSERPRIPDLRSQIADAMPKEISKPAGSRLAQLPSLKERKPSKFFDKYNPKQEDGRQETGARSEPPAIIEAVSEHADVTETIGEIRAEIGPDCTRCKLSQLGRTQVVNSVGNENARLMFCGEAPGADEDRLGEPFVGRAGQLLTDIIEKGLEIPRKDVFIGNINRCRPPGNRAPEEDESSVCKPFILREIAVVRPKVIVTLGATATQNLLETKMPQMMIDVLVL